MRLFLDTANLDEIRTAARWGILGGVTTNPTLVAAEGVDLERRIQEICAVVDGPVSAEVIETEVEAAVRQGWDLFLDRNDGFVGMTGFGASAPAADLYRHFGITADAVADAVKCRVERTRRV